MAEIWYTCSRGHRRKLEKNAGGYLCECGATMTPSDTGDKGGNTKRHPVPQPGKLTPDQEGN
jgi:hypothetical protein